MVYDSAATRARLLDAAYAEFVERGLAGARVDRIAAAAAANKQAIYAYFGSKEALFDAVISHRFSALADVVPFTPDDLPGYAAALFDYLLAKPEHLRLNMWKALERPAGSDSEVAAYRAKLDALHHLGVAEGTALDLILLALGAASSWATAADGIRALGGGQDGIVRHRRAVVDSVTAAVAALTN
jgi:AcrR family transcriptional regulator